MLNTFYVTTQEIEHPEREHSYRLPAGENLPEGHRMKTQRKAGEFKFADSLAPSTVTALAQLANSL